MDIKRIDDEATARRLLDCIAAACGFKAAWLSLENDPYNKFLYCIKFKRNEEYGIHDIVTFPVKASAYAEAVKELLDRLDKQGQILLRDNSFDECPTCWLKKEDVFGNGILKFETALMGVELNG